MVYGRRRQVAGAADRRDRQQEVTDRIIAALEQGTLPWRQPWDPAKAGRDMRPFNMASGRRYGGINVLLLAMDGRAWGGADHRWCTYEQAKAKGWQVRKGETGTTVFFVGQAVRKDRSGGPADAPVDTAGDPTARIARFYKAHNIFHASQIDGVPDMPPLATDAAPWKRIEAVDTMLERSGAVIRYGGPAAFYAPASDHIQLPMRGAFHDTYGLASTATHELLHWSGAGHRLARDLSGRFGSASYAFEEMIAELGSCQIGMTLGLPCDVDNHASYVGHWLDRLKADKTAIFKAAAAAQRAVDYCLAFHPDFSAAELDAGSAEPLAA